MTCIGKRFYCVISEDYALCYAYSVKEGRRTVVDREGVKPWLFSRKADADNQAFILGPKFVVIRYDPHATPPWDID